MTPDDLVEWRKINKYSQIMLGKVLGVTTITVYRWEKGMREIPTFLHLALKYLELKGGDLKEEVTGKTKEVKNSMKGDKAYGKGKGNL